MINFFSYYLNNHSDLATIDDAVGNCFLGTRIN